MPVMIQKPMCPTPQCVICNPLAFQPLPFGPNTTAWASLCSWFIIDQFQVSELPPADYFPLLRVYVPWNPPHPNLCKYIGYIFSRVRPQQSVLEYTLFLLLRAKDRLAPNLRRSGHTLFFVAYMVAIKYLCDLGEYPAETWAQWSHNVIKTSDLNRLEREFCAALDWNIDVKPENLKRFSDYLRQARFRGTSAESMDWIKMPAVEEEPGDDYLTKVRDLGRRVKEMLHAISSPTQKNTVVDRKHESHEMAWITFAPLNPQTRYIAGSRKWIRA